MRRNLIIVLLVLLIAAAGFIYFTQEENTFSRETSLYKAVPISAPFFVEISSVQAFSQQTDLQSEVKKISAIQQLFTEANRIDSLIRNNAEIPKSLSRKSLLLVLDIIGEDEINPVFIAEVAGSSEIEGIETLVKAYLGQSSVNFLGRNYNGFKLYSSINADGAAELHFSFANGLFIVSNEVLLVEKCIRQLSAESILADNSFVRANKSVMGQTNFALYINHVRVPTLLANYLNGSRRVISNEFGQHNSISYKRAIHDLAQFAAWTELDLNFRDEQMELKGMSSAEDSLYHFLSVFEDQEPVNLTNDEVLPQNTTVTFNYLFTNKEKFFARVEDYFAHTSRYYKREELFTKMEQGFRTDFKEALQQWVKSQVSVALTKVGKTPDETTSVFMFNLERKDNIKEQFSNMMARNARRNDKKPEDYLTQFKAADGSNYVIYTFPYPSFPGIWLGKTMEMAHARYAVFYNNNLLFASSLPAMKSWLDEVCQGDALTRSGAYRNFQDGAENRMNLSMYIDLKGVYHITPELLATEVNAGFDKNKDVLQKFNQLGWQLLREKDGYYHNLNLLFGNPVSVAEDALWQCNLGAKIVQQPYVVKNHNTKAVEIIVQDESDKLNLIDGKGSLLWSIPIDGKIMSKIHQIDYFKNGKLQYLFNTDKKLYVIDREGNSVQGFPVEFDLPASNGVSVFDYDNNREYRYFLAFSDNNVKAFNRDGAVVSGWLFKQTKSEVTTPVQHIRIKNRDYIVFKDKNKIYIQNRRGATRVETPVSFQNSQNPLVLNNNGVPKILASSDKGKVFQLFFDGKYKEKEVGTMSSDHFFTGADINASGQADYVFMDGRNLEVYDEDGNKLFAEKMDNRIQTPPVIYRLNGAKAIGITDRDEKKVYLFDEQGAVYPGFPLAGTGEFIIENINNKMCLVTPLNKSVVCYLLE